MVNGRCASDGSEDFCFRKTKDYSSRFSVFLEIFDERQNVMIWYDD